MADEEDIAALVIDNGSGMCKGKDLPEALDDCRFDYLKVDSISSRLVGVS